MLIYKASVAGMRRQSVQGCIHSVLINQQLAANTQNFLSGYNSKPTHPTAGVTFSVFADNFLHHHNQQKNGFGDAGLMCALRV